MAYIGKTPTVGNFQVCDAISVVNGQAAYTLQVGGVNVAPESANHMLVSLNGILQKPGSSFTISGSTMTFASNLATGDVIDFVQILGNVLDIGQPSDDTVTAAKIVDDAISEEHLDVTAITGHTAETSAADADTILIHDASASALRKMTRSNFLSGVGGDNTPAFLVTRSSSQGSIFDGTDTKVQFNNEIFDTDNTFDSSSNYRWTPGVAGKIFMTAGVDVNVGGSVTFLINVSIYKSGSKVAEYHLQQADYDFPANTVQHYHVNLIDQCTDSNYYEVFVNANNQGNDDISVGSTTVVTYSAFFGGYKIIT